MSRVNIDFSSADKALLNPLQKKLVAVGFMVEEEAKRLSPVNTGRLRASISTNWSESGMTEGNIGAEAEEGDGVKEPFSKENFTVVVGSNVEYAPYMEFGTSRVSAHPFLRPALEKYSALIEKLLS
jgi:HK97 gp10 family phage protein